jgi:monooxygenase
MPAFNELPKEIDVVVVGAGLSGVNQAYRIQSETKQDYLILESRHEMGGTWSLFNYSGVRSDSDVS